VREWITSRTANMTAMEAKNQKPPRAPAPCQKEGRNAALVSIAIIHRRTTLRLRFIRRTMYSLIVIGSYPIAFGSCRRPHGAGSHSVTHLPITTPSCPRGHDHLLDGSARQQASECFNDFAKCGVFPAYPKRVRYTNTVAFFKLLNHGDTS
jgi:hypothetical protein